MTYKVIGQDPDLVAGWDMPQGVAGTVFDVSGNGFDASLVGGPQQGSDRFGGYLGFDGAVDYLKNSALDSYPQGKEVLSLLSVVSFTDNSTLMRIICGWYYTEITSLNIQHGLVQFSARSASNQTVQSDDLLNDGRPHFVVGTYDKDAGSSNVNLYVDGIAQAVPKTSTGAMVSTSKFNIGARDDASNTAYSFPGNIYNAAIYNTAKSAAWIEQEYKRFLSFQG